MNTKTLWRQAWRELRKIERDNKAMDFVAHWQTWANEQGLTRFQRAVEYAGAWRD